MLTETKDTNNDKINQPIKINFTKTSITGIQTQDRDKNYFDTGVNGLYLIARSSGAKVFWVRGRINGVEKKCKIGKFPNLSVEQARKIAMDYISAFAQHKDPCAEKLKLKNDITFGEMFNSFLENYAKRQKKTGSCKGDTGAFNNHLIHLKNKKASLITKEDVMSIHTKIGDRGHKTNANRVLEKIKAIFNYAINSDGWKGNNPANGIKKNKEKSRQRILLENETGKFFRALEAEHNRTAKDFILVALLTGVRKTNVLSMKWSDINFDFELPYWDIPETKNGERHISPLIPILIELLKARKELLRKTGQHNSPFVFPGSGKQGYFQDPKKAWNRILAQAEIATRLTIHDLRRTIATVISDNQVNAETLRNVLGHKSGGGVTSTYARTQIEAKMKALEGGYKKIIKNAGGINKWWLDN